MYTNFSSKRFGTLALTLLTLGLVILVRTLHHQVIDVDKLVSAAPIVTDPAPRGIVVDRNGVPLIVNRHYYQIAATPNHIRTDAARQEVARQLESLLGLPATDTYAILNEMKDYQFAILADAVSLEKASLLKEYTAHLVNETTEQVPLQNVYAKPMTRRSYPQENLTSHVTGFVTVNSDGVSGIESYYDGFLPADGIGLLYDDAVPLDSLSVEVRRFLPSPAAKDLVLTVDRTVQWIIYEELARGLDEFGAESGTIIVMEPSSGEILGMVNLPDFDPNRYEEAPMESFPNPAISAQYEPGSVFKIITVGAALDTGIVEPGTIFTDTGTITIGDRVIFNSNRMAHGRVTVTDALARSLNVVTAQIADLVGSEKFYPYIRQFGFGDATNVDLSGEIEGAIKSPGHHQWSLSDLATNSFGQGLAVTPLQMASATAAIANGGKLMQPHIVKARIAGDKVQFSKPIVMQQAISPETAKTLTDMMVEVVDSGNIKASIPGYRIAGKSGTAQIPTPDGYEKNATIVTFVGFAPADDPQFVVLVKMDRPDIQINQWASHTAAPVFSRVTKRLLDYYSIPPLPDDADGPNGPTDGASYLSQELSPVAPEEYRSDAPTNPTGQFGAGTHTGDGVNHRSTGD